MGPAEINLDAGAVGPAVVLPVRPELSVRRWCCR
jgi:hypothetical protein